MSPRAQHPGPRDMFLPMPRCSSHLLNVLAQEGIALLSADWDTLARTKRKHAHEHILHHDVSLRHDCYSPLPLGLADVVEAIFHVLCGDFQFRSACSASVDVIKFFWRSRLHSQRCHESGNCFLPKSSTIPWAFIHPCS